MTTAVQLTRDDSMINSNRGDAGTRLRNSRRWLFGLLILFVPLTLLASKLSDVLHSDLIIGLIETAFMIAFLAVSIWVYVAHCKFVGKYPFYWLFRKYLK